jgi:gamma-glutamylputrescine oxidase
VQPRIARAVLPVATYVAVTAKIGPGLAKAIRWPGAISDTRRAGDYYRIVDGDRLLWGGRITTDTREPPRLRALMRGDILWSILSCARSPSNMRGPASWAMRRT